MVGDSHDLSLLLVWAKDFWSAGGLDDEGFDSGFLVAVGQAVIRLCRGFEAAEKAHRVAHGLAAAKKSLAVRSLMRDSVVFH